MFTSHTRASLKLFIITACSVVSLAFALPRFAMAVEPICPGGSTPSSNVLFCDDFEDGSLLSSPSWEVANYCDSYPNGNYVNCGSPRGGYGSNCAVWSDPIGFCGTGWTHSCAVADATQKFSVNEIYVRLYVYFSSDYQWGEGDKGIYVLGTGINAKIEFSRWGNRQFTFSSYAQNPNEAYQNQGGGLTMQGGKWYLLEFHLIPNTDGQANGTVEIWADDATSPVTTQTLRLRATNVKMRYDGQGNNPITGIHFEMQNADSAHPSSYACNPGMMAFDQFVVSKSRIGPMGNYVPQAPPSAKAPNPPIIKGIE